MVSCADIILFRKTQIAIEYAWKLHQEAPDLAIFWIRASSADRFVQSYTQIARQFQIPGFDDPSKGKLELVRDWLVSYPSRWLLVIDNADDYSVLFGDDKPPSAAGVLRPEEQAESATRPTSSGRASPLCQYIPESPNGTILLTSRNKQVGSSFLRGRSKGLINVQGFSNEDATRFLQDMIGDQNEKAVLALVTELERLPLALSQAAAYIQTRCITVSKYLDLLRGSLVELFDQPFEDHGRDGTDIPNAVAATWALSFNQIQSQSPLAGILLSVMTCLEREVIPRDFLYTCLENFANHSTPTSSHVQIEDALGLLKAYSLTAEAYGEKLLTVHRLVHLVARTWLQRKGEHATVGELVLLSIWKGFPPYFDLSCLLYLPSMMELHQTIASTKSLVTSKCRRVLAQVNVSSVLMHLWLDADDGERGLLEDALKLFQKSVTSLEALKAASIGIRFTNSLMALLNHEISWEAADERFSGLETEATVAHDANSMDAKWAQWGRDLVQRRCPSVCKIRAIAAKERLQMATSMKELLRPIAEGSSEKSTADPPEMDEAAARNAANAKVMFDLLSHAEEDMVVKLEAADQLHEKAKVELDALHEIAVICKNVMELFDAMPLEERLAKYGATTWNEYSAGMAAEKRLARRDKLRVEGVE
jgi:hypothetical protein